MPSEAPTIDADLSDPVWAKAAVIDNFTQRQPNPYEPATERTVVRILYDENNLYVLVLRLRQRTRTRSSSATCSATASSSPPIR